MGTGMPDQTSARAAHDELLRLRPDGAEHDVTSCVFCAGSHETAKEDAVPEPRTFTEAEHEAILTDAVTREVARATDEKDATIASLEAKVDVLEAEKAAESKAREDAVAELEAFKQQIETAREVEARKADRVSRIKEVAADLPDEYFSDERVQRWAEMAAEQFEALLDDLADATVAKMTPEEAKLLDGLEGDARRTKIVEINGARKARESAKETGEPQAPLVAETAAFSGGQSPAATATGSTARQYLASRGRLPAAR